MENEIKTINCLIYFYSIDDSEELKFILSNFCGKVFAFTIQDIDIDIIHSFQHIFICGNIENISLYHQNIHAIRELSIGTCNHDYIHIGEVPILIKNIGIYYRQIFESHFEEICAAHQFQTLTESNKPGQAYRTGIYLSEVVRNYNAISDELQFNLLRCSTNFAGATENFADIDKLIIKKANEIAARDFKEKINFNHVLAQIYHNSKIGNKDKKAKIKEHCDKTKDMPRESLIAFCTFYDATENLSSNKLTKLRFRLKKSVKNRGGFQEKIDIILHPSSMLIIPLSTNRLYTHEIIPSQLPIDKIPTRLGYVIRCSNKIAIYKDGETYIDEQKLHAPAAEEIKMLKEKYSEENRESYFINYDEILFSLNQGDYMEPII